MKFSKTRKVKSPEYAHIKSDAGIDFFIPQFNDEFINDLMNKNNNNIQIQDGNIIILPHQRILIPSGIYVNVPHNRALIANNKSGIATKLGLIYGASVIDNGYQGQVHISLINTSNKIVTLMQNQKIIQFILHVIDNNNLIEVDFDDLYSTKSQRQKGGFGHTNEK